LSQSMVRQDHGDLVLDWDGLAAHPLDLRRRILVAALVWVGTAAYPPRREDILSLLAEGGMDGQRTLMGCILRQERGGLRIFREFNAVRDLRGATDAVWDGRWRLEGPHDPALCLAALGEAGLRLCPDWRETGRARASLLTSPAIWRGDRLVAAPLAGWGQGWIARIVADFHDTALSH
jgi:tRNA(Ile)-lysidine synthase